MKLVATRKSEQNESVIDPWSIVHIGAGLALGLMGVRPSIALTLAVGYEAAEQVLERTELGHTTFQTSGPETPANAVVDVLVYMGAWYLGNAWNKTG